jgi:alanyl aminopeptidase
VRLRAVAVPLVAIDGKDAALAREARRLAGRWQVEHAGLPPAVRGIVFQTAAITAGKDAPALFDGFVVALRASRDANERDDLLRALGLFSDPALAQRGLALTLDPTVEGRDGVQLLRAALEHPQTRTFALGFIDANFDRLAARTPREQQSRWLTSGERICSADERARYVAVLGKRAADIEGGARYYRQTLEKIDLCVAARRTQEAPLNAFLGAQK